MPESAAVAASELMSKGKTMLTTWGAPLLGGLAGFFAAPLFKGVMEWVADYIWAMGQKGAGDWASWSGEISFVIFFVIFLGIAVAMWKMSAGNWMLRTVAGFFAGVAIRVGLGAVQSILIPGPGPAPNQFGW